MSVADKMGFGPKRVVRTIPLDDGSGRYRYEIDVTPHPMMGADLPTLTVKLNENQYLGYLAWQNGQLIQNCLPDLNASQREVLMSGLGDDDFHELAMEEDEDDEDDE
jgi:hypothetical protein